MILHAEHGFRGKIIDLDTGLPISKVIWLDTDNGVLEAYKTTTSGEYARDINGNFTTYRARGRFRYIPSNGKATNIIPSRVPKILMGAPKCVKCGNPLTLPGDDLCPPCRAKDRGQKNRMLVERLTTPLFDAICSIKGCGRIAGWSVSDEVRVTPIWGSGILGRKKCLYDRGMTVGRRWYCSRHYRPPRLLDAKGDVIEEFEEANGVRPQ
jgi:hypothetical protein